MLVRVTDVNDNAPTLAHPYRPVLMESVPSSKVVELAAKDIDDGTRGNGPPFNFSIDPKTSDIIKASFKVETNLSKFKCALYVKKDQYSLSY